MDAQLALFSAVDQYICERLLPADDVLDKALDDSNSAGLPAIHVAPNQGKLLSLLARSSGARRILEIGTLGGYSTIWLARALPAGGRLITLELDPMHAEVAASNLRRAGLDEIVDIRVGPALTTLSQLYVAGVEPFDFIFIDADKTNMPAYLESALKLSRSGTVIIADNVVRSGAILQPDSTDASVQGVRKTYDLLAAQPCLDATAIQTVGNKGHDGFVFALVTL